MIRLPDELTLLILGFLEAGDLKQVQQVSHRFLKLGRDAILWREHCYARSYEETKRSQLCADAKLSPNTSRSRTLWVAAWEPAYADESIDYYEEYVQAHAPISVEWKNVPNISSPNKDDQREITGLATFDDAGRTHAVCPVDDGSVLIYDLSAKTQSHETGGHSGPGLLVQNGKNLSDWQRAMRAGTAAEVVSVDSRNQRAYFAVEDYLHEVDLQTLSLVSSRQMGASISVLSACGPSRPLMVGTRDSIAIYDQRNGFSSTRLEAPLPEPGLTSILHLPRDMIVAGGRFYSLLQYSLRSFPKVMSTQDLAFHVYSMTTFPHRSSVRHDENLLRGTITHSEHRLKKAMPGYTIVCAGSRMGNGSLSLDACENNRSPLKWLVTAGIPPRGGPVPSVAAYGSKIVYSTGNLGTLEWHSQNGTYTGRSYLVEANSKADNLPTIGQDRNAQAKGDIVRKIIPYTDPALLSGRRPQKLLLWSGEGKLGTLSFGPADLHRSDEYFDAVEVQVESIAERAKQDAERQYAMAMRRAFERNADEVRFVRGLGMGDFTP